MTLWRVEWLRLLRTKRLVALLGVFVTFGFLGPFTARYANVIFEKLGGAGVAMVFPGATPPDGFASYVGNAMQIGLVVLVVIAAGAMCFDADPASAAFYRTRVGSMRRLIVPRVVVNAIAGIGAFLLGTLAAWYETVVLIGRVPVGAVVGGAILCSLFIAFAVALVAVVATVLRSRLTTVMMSLGVLLLLPVVGMIRGLSVWLPSRLVGSLEWLVAGAPASDYARAAGVTLVVTPALVLLSVRLAKRREI